MQESPVLRNMHVCGRQRAAQPANTKAEHMANPVFHLVLNSHSIPLQ